MAEIVRKIGKITKYETKSYVGHARILDLDRSAAAGEAPKTDKEPLDAARDDPPPSAKVAGSKRGK
jgi:hypothetical protein